MKRVAVLGAGAWGTALAIVLAPRLPTTLWARDPAQARAMAATRRNDRYLPGIDLPPGLALTSELSRAADADLLVLATPMAGLRPTLRAALEARASHHSGVVWLCKGFEAGTGCLPHQVAAQVLPDDFRRGVLSGPSFAEEVARGLPCALTLASRDEPFAREAAALLHGGRMRVYFSADLTGVEVGGAVKNVMAIAAGICDGLALGQNARAALITRGLAEIRRLGVALGGEPETFMGLSGAGDLILTTTGDLSRNRRVGLELARGHALAGILERLGHVAEGVHTTREVARIAAERGVEMPVTAAVHAVLEGRLTAVAAVDRLLSRDPRSER